jgi:hypothetical protein
MHVLTSIGQATPQWLTDVLRRRGIMARAEVLSLTADLILDYNSRVFRLTPTYCNSEPQLPLTLILKLKQGSGARDELTLAQKFAPHLDRLPMLVPLYDAVYCDQQDAGHFLMPDLSRTHIQTTRVTGGRSVPPDPHLTRMINTIARVGPIPIRAASWLPISVRS